MSFWKTVGTIGGGALGSFVGQPMLGAAIGGGLGGLADGKGEGGEKDPKEAYRSRLLNMVERQATGPLTETASYRSGAAGLREADAELAAADERTARANGLQGGSYSVARAADRGQRYTSGLTRLVGTAGREQQGALALGLATSDRDRDRDDRRKANRMNAIGSGLTTLVDAGARIYDSRNNDAA